MTQEERRNDSGRRVDRDRRQNGSSMISSYSNYGGAERRSNIERRYPSDRRAVTS